MVDVIDPLVERSVAALAREVICQIITRYFGIDPSVKGGKRRCVVVVPKRAAPGNP